MTKVTSVLRLSYKFRGVKNKCSYRHTYKWHPLFLIHKDTLNKLGYKAKINIHTTSYIN